MKKETNDFLEFVDKEFIGESVNKESWIKYLRKLPRIYRGDITFRLLFEWHWDLIHKSGSAGILQSSLDNEDPLFIKQINLIRGIGKNVYNLGYQYNELIFFHARVDLTGKHLLEVGGALPNDVLFEEIGIAKYTNIESPDYIHSSGGDSFSDRYKSHPLKKTIYCNAENIDEHIQPSSIDEIFSVACFEHIYNLPKALKSCYKCLKSSGHLFSYFAPIYSHLEQGDHNVIPTHNLIPEKPIGFHLLSHKDQRKKLLELGINNPSEIQDFLGHVNFNRIPNRLLAEDYIRTLTESPFYVMELQRKETFNISKSYPAQVAEVRESNPSIRDLMTMGFRVVLFKD